MALEARTVTAPRDSALGKGLSLSSAIDLAKAVNLSKVKKVRFFLFPRAAPTNNCLTLCSWCKWLFVAFRPAAGLGNPVRCACTMGSDGPSSRGQAGLTKALEVEALLVMGS